MTREMALEKHVFACAKHETQHPLPMEVIFLKITSRLAIRSTP